MSQASGVGEPKYYNDPTDEQAEQLAWLLDSSIGIGRFTIGLDPILTHPLASGICSRARSVLIVVRRWLA
jgi:hypothetical protein